MIMLLISTVWFLIKAFVAIYVAAILLGALVSVYQERKIWQNPNLPNLSVWGMVKVYLMNVLWMGACTVGVLMTPLYCLKTGSQKTRPWAHGVVENWVAAKIADLMVAPTVVNGKENIPDLSKGDKPAPVYIANHASQADIAVVYHLQSQWRWIAKSSVMFLPGVGQLMWLSDHVFIDRVKKSSGNKSFTGARHLYVHSKESLDEGVPMFFFPQGTRRLGERLPFKDGAFKVAMESGAPLIPVSLDIPLTAWNSMHPFVKAPPVVITVHKPIESKDKELEALKREAFDVIYSVLPDFSKQDKQN
eukprot:Nitzschia sp. Nitz4//scaffold82_size85912//10982//11893//NITZ4_005126-RA/size85912-processed-gene-0.23-mRNA-1//-1//CDS//3329558790//5898//frame0